MMKYLYISSHFLYMSLLASALNHFILAAFSKVFILFFLCHCICLYKLWEATKLIRYVEGVFSLEKRLKQIVFLFPKTWDRIHNCAICPTDQRGLGQANPIIFMPLGLPPKWRRPASM